MKKILSLTRQAIQKYNMIRSGDCVAIALSGGKDSFILCESLKLLRNFYPEKFDIGVIYINIGFEKTNSEIIYNYCKKSNIQCHIENSIIKDVVFDKMQSKNPCSLCSRMRRAILCETAKKLGYNKIALGHNKNDANETFLMNLMYNGKIECFEPRTRYEDIDIEIIRPLILCDEKIIRCCATKYSLPVCEKICPADGKTDREKIKKLISTLSQDNPKIKDNVFSAIQKQEIYRSKEVDNI